jgi:deoxycytidine triphosphate deaminase
VASYSTSLQRSLIDRASALGSYIEALQTRNGRNDDGYALALEMCRVYTKIVQLQLREEWERAYDDESRERIIRGWAIEFLARETWIDQHFARGAQGDVPRALKTMARREFVRHGLNDYEPVLTVGPPDNFETDDKTNLWRYLFNNLRRFSNHPELRALPGEERRLSMISVPYIEGTRALWHPITLGHEIGHIRLENERTQGTYLATGDWVDEVESGFAGLIDPAESWARTRGAQMPSVHVIRTTLQKWVDEILCDLNAVRLFGAAGVSAIAEFLAVVSSSAEVGPETPTLSHPPLSVRLGLMFHVLREVGISDDKLPPHTKAWRDYLKQNTVRLGPLAQYIANLIADPINRTSITDYALTWGDVYFGLDRATEIEWLRCELLDAVPGGTHCLREGPRKGAEIETADLVNAAWDARSVLDDPPSDGGGAQAGDGARFVLLETDDTGQERRLSWHDRRLAIDSLATKAIDSVEFARLWQLTGGGVEDITQLDPATHPALGGTGAVLSKVALAKRLNARGPGRLVVTPLLQDSVQDAGIDLRLGPEFIVFRHTATGAFDALDDAHDPRMLQEALEKDWGVPFILHPGELVLAATLEYIVLPEDVAAQVVTRSSYGRLGLMTATAVQVQPGSRGCITLELVNHADTPIALSPGSRVAQLVFFKIDEPGKVTPGKYRFPVGPQFSKVELDRDAVALKRLLGSARARLERDDNVGETIVFEAVLPEQEGTRFQEIAAFEGFTPRVKLKTAEVGLAAPRDLVARMLDGQSLVSLTVAGTAAITAFAAAVEKLVRFLSHGVVIEIDEQGKATVSAPETLPRGTIVVTAPPDVDVRITSHDRRLEQLTDALRDGVAARRRKVPPDDWAFEKLDPNA